jgi:hypothetical protein
MSTVAVPGMKQPLGTSSHPGAPEPIAGTIVTSVWSANASFTGITKTPTNNTPKTRKRKLITILHYAKIPIKTIDDT